MWDPVAEKIWAAYGDGLGHNQRRRRAVEDQEPCGPASGFDRPAVAFGQAVEFCREKFVKAQIKAIAAQQETVPRLTN